MHWGSGIGPGVGKAGGLGSSRRAGQFVAVARPPSRLLKLVQDEGGPSTAVKTDPGVVHYSQDWSVCECRLALGLEHG